MMDSNAKAIVFDLDGTLVDSAEVCARLFNGMLADKNCQRRVTAACIQATLSIGGIPMIRSVLEDACTDPTAELAEFRRRYEEMPTPEDSLYPGIRQLLEKLRQSGYRLGLCTKKPERLAHKVLRELHLTSLFQAISCGDSTEYPKPDARHLTSVLVALNCTANNAWMVGDSSVDASLARNADVRFAFATYGYGADEVDEADCDLVFRHAGELADQLIMRDLRPYVDPHAIAPTDGSRTALTQ